MTAVRVSFLLGGERFHGRLNRSSALSDVPAKATRVNRAGPSYKLIRLRGLSHTRQYGTDQAVFLRRAARGSHFPFVFSSHQLPLFFDAIDLVDKNFQWKVVIPVVSSLFRFVDMHE